jgi:hypothetical protein
MIISLRIGKLLKLIAISLFLLIVYCVYANAYDIQTSITNGKSSGESKPVNTPVDNSGIRIALLYSLGELLITNPQNRKAGFNPITKMKYQEIDSLYLRMALDPEDFGEMLLEIYWPITGNYHLQVFGIEQGIYTLDINAHNPDLSSEFTKVIKDIPI